MEATQKLLQTTTHPTAQKPAKPVKLLQEIQLKKEEGSPSVSGAKPSIDTLQSMILDRLN